MPSWPNSPESSEASRLWDFHDADYCPEMTEDIAFSGVALGSGLLCRVHKLEPVRSVAFGGRDTGRRFYMCQIENEVYNCGFVAWHDEQEWPETMGNALVKLWDMYDTERKTRLDERIDSGKLLQEVVKEKEKVDKDYASLMHDVSKFMNSTERDVMQVNYAKLTEEKREMAKIESEEAELKKENNKLTDEVVMLKQLQKSQAEVMRSNKQDWESEREGLKEEKKKLEYYVFDLIKARDEDKAVLKAEKDKIKRIKAICDE